MEQLITASSLDVSYRKLEHVIVFRWLRPILSDEDFTASYYTLLEAAVQHNCRYWLLDLRRRVPNTAAQDAWLLHNFLPRLEAAFPTAVPVHAAYLVAPPALEYYTEVLLPALTNPVKTHFRATAFIDEGPANAWLNRQQMA